MLYMYKIFIGTIQFYVLCFHIYIYIIIIFIIYLIIYYATNYSQQIYSLFLSIQYIYIYIILHTRKRALIEKRTETIHCILCLSCSF